MSVLLCGGLLKDGGRMLQQAWNARPVCVDLFYSGTEVLDKNDLKVLDKECPEYYVF